MKLYTIPEVLGIDSSLPISMIDYSSAKEITKEHINLTHNTFSFLQEGKKEVIADNGLFSIENTDFLLMKAGHCLMTEKLSFQAQQYRSVLLFFSNEEVQQFVQKFRISIPKSSNELAVQSFTYDSYIQQFVHQLAGLAQRSTPLQLKLLPTKWEEIMLYLVEMYGSEILQSILSSSDNKTQQFVEVVENNKLNKLTLKELAFLTHMSVSSFKRTFEKQYNEAPMKWFQARRLEYAAYLINQKQKRASDIFFEVGYENLSSFIQAYKSKFGITPKQDANN